MAHFDELTGSRLFKPLVVVLIVGLVAVGLAQGGLFPLPRQQVAGGFQGITEGAYGYQVGSAGTTVLGNALPHRTPACSYAWNGYSTSGFSIVALSPQGIFGCSAFVNSDTLYYQAQGNVVPYQPAYTQPITGQYSVAVPGTGGNQTETVSFKVNEYQFNLNVGIESGGSGYNFAPDVIWGVIYDNVWDQTGAPGGPANCDPALATAQSQCVFEAPLFGQVSNFTPSQYWGSDNCLQCTSGAALSFYLQASASGVLNTFGGSAPPTGSAVSKVLGNAYAPDSAMSRLVYYPMDLTEFHCQSTLFGCNGIQGSFTVTLYTLQIGEYVTNSQNPSGQTLSKNPTQQCSGLNCQLLGFEKWISSPFTLLGLGGLGLLGIGVVILIVAGPTVVALVMLLQNRRRGERAD